MNTTFRAYDKGRDVSGECTEAQATSIATRGVQALGRPMEVLSDEAARSLGYVDTRGGKI